MKEQLLYLSSVVQFLLQFSEPVLANHRVAYDNAQEHACFVLPYVSGRILLEGACPMLELSMIVSLTYDRRRSWTARFCNTRPIKLLVRKQSSLSHLCINASFYQDRLGTNMGKTQKRARFLAASLRYATLYSYSYVLLAGVLSTIKSIEWKKRSTCCNMTCQSIVILAMDI